MKHKITNEQAEYGFGIELAHERMENGELRFRLFGDDQNGYIRTMATSKGGWQNSHAHTQFREFYLVEFGWLAMAVPGEGVALITIYNEGECCLSPVGQTHNVYLSPNSIIHTIKFGIRNLTPGFEERPDFDSLTQALTQQDILRLGRQTPN